MKNTFKVLLIGVTIGSSVIAINKNSTVNNLKTELEFKVKENKNLYSKLEYSSSNLSVLNKKNKKLSKRVVKEINKIITLTDSVDYLDKNLKKDQKKLARKTSVAKRLIKQKKQLEKEISEKNAIKKAVSFKKETQTASLETTNIETTLMRKKNNGSFVTTLNSKKIDAIKTNFKIINNNLTESGKKKISISVFNSNNRALAFNDIIEIDYNNEDLDVTSIIEVERKKIEKGTYNIVAYIDGKKINSSLAYID